MTTVVMTMKVTKMTPSQKPKSPKKLKFPSNLIDLALGNPQPNNGCNFCNVVTTTWQYNLAHCLRCVQPNADPEDSYIAAVNSLFYLGKTFVENPQHISKCQHDWDTNLVELIVTALSWAPPCLQQTFLSHQKSVTQAAAIAAIQQKYNNAKAAYPGKIRQYNDFLPLKAHTSDDRNQPC